MSVLSEGTLHWAPRFNVSEEAWRRALPDADAGGRIALGCNLMHVRIGEASILIDPGFDEPDSAFQEHFAAKWPGSTRTPGLTAALAQLGVDVDAITHVVITHAHDDHFAGVVRTVRGEPKIRCPQAWHFLGRGDWAGNPRLEDPASTMATRLRPVQAAGRLVLVEDALDIAPGVTMLPAPGETPGHSIVRVRSAGAAAYYVGDLIHHACEATYPDWVPGPARDGEMLLRTRLRVFEEIAANRGLAVFAHDRFPAWSRVSALAGGYRWNPEADTGL